MPFVRVDRRRARWSRPPRDSAREPVFAAKSPPERVSVLVGEWGWTTNLQWVSSFGPSDNRDYHGEAADGATDADAQLSTRSHPDRLQL